MIKELQEDLFDRYPKIFIQRTWSSSKSAMCWGIQCPDAWFGLLDELCGQLQRYTDSGGPQVEAIQIKEKFGSLRFYADGVDPYSSGLIRQAEDRSYDVEFRYD